MNLFCYIPNDSDATSFYRGIQPIAHLRHLMPDLTVFYAGKTVTMGDLSHIDVAFIQRPHGPDHLSLIHFCHELGITVWVDYDDNLLCVPPYNPAFQFYGSDQTRNTIEEILRCADVISVSTAQLKRDFEKITKKPIFVIPNAFNDYLFKQPPVFKPHNVVMWRGTESHQSDLFRFSPAIIDASQKHPKWLFHFMGYKPWYLLDAIGNRSIYTPPVNILKYHSVIKQTYPNIVMVALTDTPFNRCKSNISWIEATFSGAVCVGPDWEEWNRPGVFRYPVNGFSESLDGALSSSESTLKNAHGMAWQYINKTLRLSQVNRLRKGLLEQLL